MDEEEAPAAQSGSHPGTDKVGEAGVSVEVEEATSMPHQPLAELVDTVESLQVVKDEAAASEDERDELENSSGGGETSLALECQEAAPGEQQTDFLKTLAEFFASRGTAFQASGCNVGVLKVQPANHILTVSNA